MFICDTWTNEFEKFKVDKKLLGDASILFLRFIMIISIGK